VFFADRYTISLLKKVQRYTIRILSGAGGFIGFMKPKSGTVWSRASKLILEVFPIFKIPKNFPPVRLARGFGLGFKLPAAGLLDPGASFRHVFSRNPATR
jgi:hypothetical protein